MAQYLIDWDGAYDAWKKSKLSRRRFQYSKQFKEFIIDGGMPSEDTVRTRFRSIRDQREANFNPQDYLENEPMPAQADDAVQIFRLDDNKVKMLCQSLQAQPSTSIKRLRQIVIRMADGRSVEFESGNAELFALRLLSCREQA